MFDSEILSVMYGLGSALTWGAGDFSGGLASKKGQILSVIFFSQAVGATLLLVLAFFVPEPAEWGVYLFWGGLAGLSGASGVVALYRGLAAGRMGVVAPVSAVLTACLPIIFTFVTTGPPKYSQIAGFALGLASVWLLSGPGTRLEAGKNELLLSLVAGLGFAGFFICIGQVSAGAIVRPLLAARAASLTLLAVILAGKRQAILPAREQFPYVVLAGILDTTGNAFFALASQMGRLDVAAILASMYPASTVMLAWGFLKERLTPPQWFGLLAALVALGLIAG